MQPAAAAALASLAIASLADATVLSISRQEACKARGGCLLACLWTPPLCRVCCSESPSPTPSPGTTAETDTSSELEPGFPPDFPPGDTVDAILETATHILAIASGEDSERIRVWIENPEENTREIALLAEKLAAVPNSPYGEDIWVQGLSSSQGRPFSLLRLALKLRRVKLEEDDEISEERR